MTFNRNVIAAGMAALVFLFTALPASASVVMTTTSHTEFDALTGTRTDIDFESFGLIPGQFQSFGTAAGLTTGGAAFVGVENDHYTLWLSNPSGSLENFQSGIRLRGPDNVLNSYLLVTLPSQVNAFGVELASGNPAGASFRIELDGIDVGLVIPTQVEPNRTFAGVQTDTSFSQVKIYLTSGTVNTHGLFDNFSYIVNAAAAGTGTGGTQGGEGGETPEAATMLTVATGLFLFGWKRRNRTAAAAA